MGGWGQEWRRNRRCAAAGRACADAVARAARSQASSGSDGEREGATPSSKEKAPSRRKYADDDDVLPWERVSEARGHSTGLPGGAALVAALQRNLLLLTRKAQRG